MPLEFINNNATIDHAARRRIRSHVAMGRNAGKTLVRPSRKKLGLGINNTAALVPIPKLIEDTRDSEGNEDTVHEIGRQVGDGLSVLSIPKQLNPGSTGLVQRVLSFISGSQYNSELSIALDATGSHTTMWVQFMFLDEASMSVTVLNNLLIKQEDPAEAIRHLSQTFRLVNKRLSGNDAVSDTTLAVVVVMAQYARLQGQYRQGLVHLQGLQRMIELRGGVSQLTRSEPGLAQMIFKTDLEYALHQGSGTRFSIGDIAASTIAMFGLPNGWRREDEDQKLPVLNSRILRKLSADLQNLLIDITYFAWLVNDASAKDRPRLSGFPFHDNLLLLGYRLNHVSPLGGPRPIDHVENLVHLGLTAFITTFLRGYDRQIPDVPILSALTRSAAQEELDDEQENRELLLWILFIGAASTFRQADDAWLVPKTARVMHALDLYTWEDVARTLGRFPWVNAVHDKAGQALWHRSASICRPPSEITSG